MLILLTPSRVFADHMHPTASIN